jgi:hypothetical protein
MTFQYQAQTTAFVVAFLKGESHEEFDRMPHHSSIGLNGQYLFFLLRKKFGEQGYRPIYDEMVFSQPHLLTHAFWDEYEPGKHTTVPIRKRRAFFSTNSVLEENGDQPYPVHA